MNLKAKRTAMGLTQAKVAEKLGVCKQQISNFERGTDVPLKHVMVLSRVLKIDSHQLMEFYLKRKSKRK